MVSAVPTAGLRHLTDACRRLGMTPMVLWIAYVGAGGGARSPQVERWLAGTDPLPRPEYDRLAQALNDAFTELGEDHPVPYADSL